jgi:ABC-type sugar transport system ATPase subunit
MVGRNVETISRTSHTTDGELVLEADGLSRGEQVRQVSLCLRAGEVVGLAGLVGSGRTELAQLLFGMDRPSSGEIRVRGSAVHFRSPKDAINAGIAYVPEDRKGLGLVLMMPVATNMLLSTLERIATAGVLRFRRSEEQVTRWKERLRIRAASTRMSVENLSGGNQQKVVLAKWLALEPRVLILNEPTRGIDVGAKAEVHQLIREIAAQGVGVLMISSELPEILAVSDRIMVMAQGRMTGELPAGEATEAQIVALAFGEGAAV